jgi:hypothetical protein
MQEDFILQAIILSFPQFQFVRQIISGPKIKDAVLWQNVGKNLTLL